MNYSALIENRKSVREFKNKMVSVSKLEQIMAYHDRSCRRLLPDRKTQLLIFGPEAGAALEGAAGYNQFLIGAPQYLVLLSEQGPRMGENAGYIMEDLILKLTDMELGSCWLTFTDSNRIKQALNIDSELEVAAIAAFGHGARSARRLRLNILSMSNVDISAKRHYFDPKRGIHDMVFLNTWGNTHKLNDHIGFFDDMLWEAFYAATQAPSYLNRQAYGFVIHDGRVSLVARPDEYTTEADGALSLGIVMLHFDSVAERWAGKLHWQFEEQPKLELPEGHRVIASCVV